jgi:hypothetical protein
LKSPYVRLVRPFAQWEPAMISGLKHRAWAIAALIVGMAGSAGALPGPPGTGPEYEEYQSPIRLQGDVLGGGLVCFAAVVAGVLLVLSKRPLSGAVLGGAGFALGVFLIVCRIEIR